MTGKLAVLGILLGDSAVQAIVSDRVYLNNAPQTKQFPYIIVENRNNDPVDSKSGKAELDIQIVGVIAYCRTQDQLIELEPAIRDALDYIGEGVSNSVRYSEITYEGGPGDFDEKFDDNYIVATDQEYKVWIRRYAITADREDITIDSETITIDQE
jgi:hypothetical protein